MNMKIKVKHSLRNSGSYEAEFSIKLHGKLIEGLRFDAFLIKLFSELAPYCEGRDKALYFALQPCGCCHEYELTDNKKVIKALFNRLTKGSHKTK